MSVRGILGAIIYKMHWILLPFKAATAVINAMCMSPGWKTRKSYFAAIPVIGILKIYQGSYFVVYYLRLNNYTQMRI